MNKKILHIVDSDAAKERVFQLINSSENEQIEVCPTYLSYGILPKNYTKKQQMLTTRILCLVFVLLSYVFATLNISIIVNIMSLSWGIV